MTCTYKMMTMMKLRLYILFIYPILTFRSLLSDFTITSLHTFLSFSSSFLIPLLSYGCFPPLWENQNVCLPCQKCLIFMIWKNSGHLDSTIKVFFIPGRSPLKPIKPGLFQDNGTHHEELTNWYHYGDHIKEDEMGGACVTYGAKRNA